MFKYFISFVLVLVFSGCANIPQTHISKERNLGGVTITWIRNDNANPSSVMVDDGLAQSLTCVVTTPEPRYPTDFINMTAFGHEILRCFYGEFTDKAPAINTNESYKIQRTINKKTMYVSWVRTQPSMQAGPYCVSNVVPSASTIVIGGNVVGCSIRTGPDSCEIYVMEPQSEDDKLQMARIGHEVAHCFLGDFHN